MEVMYILNRANTIEVIDQQSFMAEIQYWKDLLLQCEERLLMFPEFFPNGSFPNMDNCLDVLREVEMSHFELQSEVKSLRYDIQGLNQQVHWSKQGTSFSFNTEIAKTYGPLKERLHCFSQAFENLLKDVDAVVVYHNAFEKGI